MTTLTTTTPAGDIGAMGPLVARLTRGGQRLRQADRDRPWALDTAVVLLVFLLFCLPDLLHGGPGDGDGPRRFRIAFTRLAPAAVLALQAGLVLPLLWRRRRPMAAFGAVRPCSSCSGHWARRCARTSPCSSPSTASLCTGGCGTPGTG